MMRFSPALRISLSLVLLTISILLFADLLGLIPERSAIVLDARKKFSESLAVQLTSLAQKRDVSTIKQTVNAVVERNDDVLSAAIRIVDQTLLAQAGEHQQHWREPLSGYSTLTHVQIPIYRQNKPWATLEVRFAPLTPRGPPFWMNSFFKLLGFVTVIGFIVYLLFMKRTLRYLDPSAVIPERVKSALDVLVEGVLLVDEKDRIVLANTAFAQKIGYSPEALLGKTASELNWIVSKHKHHVDGFPWVKALAKGQSYKGIPLALRTRFQGERSLMVNGAPILDGSGKRRGALATFDDVTVLEQKNAQLEKMVQALEMSQEEIKSQNEQLTFLATRDPLTGCFNRRCLFEALESAWLVAEGQGQDLSCIMCDIDYFKAVNDNHGHSVGDAVIKMVAGVLDSVSESYVVGRYGGEEFCIVLPATPIDTAVTMAESCRHTIAMKVCMDIQVTASFGVSTLSFGATSVQELINQADRALYGAKKNGRNRVMRWDDEAVHCTLHPPTSRTRAIGR